MRNGLILLAVSIFTVAGCAATVAEEEDTIGGAEVRLEPSSLLDEEAEDIGSAEGALAAACRDDCKRSCFTVLGWLDVVCWRECSIRCDGDDGNRYRGSGHGNR